MTINGRNAIVTGGTRGIGRSIALGLARNGVNVAITYISNDDKAKEVIDEIKKFEVKGIAVKADISEEKDVKNMVELVLKQFDSVDILINNAGITKDGLLVRMKSEDWDSVINTNLRGTYLVTKAVSKNMIRQKSGIIVNIASVVGLTGNAGQSNYSASKAGIIGFTKTVAKELGGRGIRVNAVAPGFVKTDMTEILKDDVKKKMIDSIPLKRCAEPEDIANAVLFLCSREASYITGQVINVDGGMVM
ncbi:3-oxoacyl-[acyl-carrier-protein] reductase [Sporanaerobacter sp. PP17-6a]|uniref:3-oxoacyl-[acyl-carrier-protein] reductase n=1 Tax=Sporanaerobacter sp. PP17-6a TaxID=1891289 RepID=UPI0008A04934|nr:3-oxoacyl-[acyl-carrier-protein] reductase [Sporanaerobacter sp. PP17-6a]SCL94210.1 3-oxoacyl-[acyl-carrier-protein] reductase FabG [Sporanaerobacter sp. PP17-6a]